MTPSKTAAALAAGILAASATRAQAPGAQVSGDAIRIGFITDLSGPYAELDGPAGSEAIRMAVADMGGVVAGKRVEVLVADHRNDAGVAAATARDWFDARRLDVLISGVNSDTSLAMAAVAREARKPFLVMGAGNTAHTNEQCSPYTVQYAYDTAAQGKVAGQGVTRAGGKSWLFLTPDYPFGVQMHDAALSAVTAAGGKISGTARHPYHAEDFTPFVRQAQASGAQVLGLAGAHTDVVNAVEAANELGAGRTMTLAATFAFITELHDLGLQAAQGMFLADSWFWTRDDETRAWSRRFFEKVGRMPSSLQAADYSAALQYLTAVKAIGSDDAEKVLSQMRQTTINDVFVRNGRIRDNGLMTHDMYLLRVKAPGASSGPWDYYDLVQTFEGEAAWLPRGESKCSPG